MAPEKDEDYQSKDQFEGMIAMAMGGRVAEEKYLEKIKLQLAQAVAEV